VAVIVRGVAKYADAAAEEYIRMILGQRVFTRGQDIREYRLYLLVKHVFAGKLPTEQQICSLFQTTTTQSRALLRAVMSKYQYELQEAIYDTLREGQRVVVVIRGLLDEGQRRSGSGPGRSDTTVNSPDLGAELQRLAVSFQGVDGDVHGERGSGNALLRGVGGDVAGCDPVARRDAQRFAV
jgi:hypothetical protein